MAGICRSCGKVSENLVTCEVCGATVCSDCKEKVGCRLCHGGKQFQSF